MRPESLEALDSFALLGPGFGDGGDGRFLLLEGLEETAGGGPRLVFAGFETPGGSARVVGARSATRVELEIGSPSSLSPRLREQGYREAVGRIREAIAAGDVYQVCLTLRAPLQASSGADVLTAMCARGVPRFAAWIRLPGGPELVSASPELFFEIAGRSVRSEPMKGTARPGHEPALEGSAKDRCELAMITDLVRHDLTPVCVPRSVRVPCARRVLELPYALQTVSDVIGELRPGVSPLEVLAALHPGGSVTGAPKQAALGMIRQLEEGPRGPYCGALGLWQGERAVFSLLIRTATRTVDGWVYGVGSGVVFDSEAERELDELHVKLGALACPTHC